jgi:hypothetical protein
MASRNRHGTSRAWTTGAEVLWTSLLLHNAKAEPVHAQSLEKSRGQRDAKKLGPVGSISSGQFHNPVEEIVEFAGKFWRRRPDLNRGCTSIPKAASCDGEKCSVLTLAPFD